MSRFFQILLVTCLAIALCAAEAPGYRSHNGRLQFSKQRSRFLARQEVAEEAGVTPYPSAKELIPDIPFDETAAAAAPAVPVATEAPAVQETDVNVSVNADLPAEQEPVDDEEEEVVEAAVAEGEHEPDFIYGPPEAKDVPAINEITPADEIEAEEEEQAEAAEAAEQEIQSARLTSDRRFNARRFAAPLAKLRAPASARTRTTAVKSARIIKARTARLQQLPQQQKFYVPQQFAAAQQQQPVLHYSPAQLRQW